MGWLVEFLTLFTVLDVLFILYFVVTARPNLRQFVFWTVVIIILPILGFVLCFNLGPVNYKGCFRTEKEILGDDFDGYAKEVSDLIEAENGPGNETEYAIIRGQSVFSHISYSKNNCIRVFEECEDYYDSLQRDLEGAMEYIHIEVYILTNDALSKRFMDVLCRKVKEGVKVRFLCDYLGLWPEAHQMILDYIDAGGEFATFNPLTQQTFSAKKSNRMHKKVIVIDGKCAYTGGINFSNDYLGLSEIGPWKDIGARLTGDIVYQMNVWFAIDWDYATKKTIPKEHLERRPIPDPGNVCMQLVTCGKYFTKNATTHYVESLIHSAKKSIHIQTPYLVPTWGVKKALIDAARSGIDVVIMISENNDFKFAGLNNEITGELLIRHGIKIYGYTKAFMHTKRIIIDGKNCSIGSINLDVLSLKYAFETNVTVFSEDVSRTMEKAFEDDLKSCAPYTRQWYKKRSLMHKLKCIPALIFRPFI